jgi:hypothetical protein
VPYHRGGITPAIVFLNYSRSSAARYSLTPAIAGSIVSVPLIETKANLKGGSQPLKSTGNSDLGSRFHVETHRVCVKGDLVYASLSRPESPVLADCKNLKI